jgi:hypothetical protein
MIVEHDSGHIIPTKPQYVQQYVQFLSPFLWFSFYWLCTRSRIGTVA